MIFDNRPDSFVFNSLLRMCCLCSHVPSRSSSSSNSNKLFVVMS